MSPRARISSPTPDGNVPDDWPLEWWEAFQALHGGATYAEAAELVRRSPSTVSRWVTRWRDQYGPEVFVSPREATLTPEARAAGQQAGGAAQAVSWKARRLSEADRYGTTAALLVDVIDQALGAFTPERIAEMTTRDVLDLARTAEILTKRADALADVVEERHDVSIEANVDLSALERKADGSETQELLAAAGDVIRQFKLVKGDRDEDERY